jgi:hypothetical protein
LLNSFAVVERPPQVAGRVWFCLKTKSKTVGVAQQQRHFLCSDKDNEAKESLALR